MKNALNPFIAQFVVLSTIRDILWLGSSKRMRYSHLLVAKRKVKQFNQRVF